MLIGLPNNPNLSRTANYTDRVSGVDMSKVVAVTFPNVGTNYIEFAYAKDGSSVAGGDYGMYRIVSGGVVWVSMSVVEKNASGEWEAKSWSDPVQWSGTSGKDGNDGRILSYTGDYDGEKSYTGNSQVAQVVKVGSTYYYTTATAGTFSGVQPPNSAYWTLFGSNFESVATGLLFAELAYIENLIVDRLCKGKDDSLPRLLAGTSEVGWYPNKSAESSVSNALVRLGINVGYMSNSGNKPGVSAKDQNDGSYSELTSDGLFSNGSSIGFRVFGLPSAASIVGLLQKRVSGYSGISSTNAAVYGVDQTLDSSEPYSEGYGGYFNKLRANGLYLGCRVIDVNVTTTLTGLLMAACFRKYNNYSTIKQIVQIALILRRKGSFIPRRIVCTLSGGGVFRVAPA